MKKNLMFLALATLGLASCNGGFKKGEGGLLYDIHTDKGGPKVKTGDFVSINLIAKTDGDSVLSSTYDSGHPIVTLMPKPQSKGDITTGIMLMAEGDSATFKISADSLFKKGQPKPPGFKGKYVIYQIKVEKLIPKGKLSEPVFQGRVTDYFKGQSEALKKQEPGKIKKYIDDNKLKVTTTPSGLNYVVTQQGVGPKPAAGDTVEVNYTLKQVSGKVLETSIKSEAVKAKMPINPMNPYKPIRFPVGQQKVIPGWDEGLLLLNKGSKATLIIPSNLAYGERGQSVIQPFTPLVFDVELVNIIHPDPNAPKPVAPPMPQMQQPVRK